MKTGRIKTNYMPQLHSSDSDNDLPSINHVMKPNSLFEAWNLVKNTLKFVPQHVFGVTGLQSKDFQVSFCHLP